mmetsp:Transcript_16345/g.25271  ORF Transcript_16345/g.25271 Transcript_16345/m.25271 type:complete len:114 (-) Transcript_16345:32-373(-)
MYNPYHEMIWGWHNAMYPNQQRPWDPDHSVVDMVAQEINDAHKQMGYVRDLEAKLKNKQPGSGNELDWEMLSRMKKDLGMKVDYKTATEQREEERASNAGWNPSKQPAVAQKK